MRVYLAAPWVDKEHAREVADILVRQGHCIATRWWDHREVPAYLSGTETHDDLNELFEQAMLDLDGVTSSDVFVLLNLQVSEGKAVETGVAICSGVPIIIVGKRSNMFHYCDLIEVVEDADQLVMALEAMDASIRGEVESPYDEDIDEDDEGGW